MLTGSPFAQDDPDEVKRLVREHPWAAFVAHTPAGLVASHYPVLLDEGADGIVLLSHVGRPDDERLALGSGGELLVIVAGPHGYVSPSLYPEGQNVPTWNHVTAHLWGVPELLDADENYRVLTRLTDHFEHGVPGGRSLADDEAQSRAIARGTAGLRVPITRFEARWKLSQNKPDDVRTRIADGLDDANPALAAEMRRIR